MKTFWFVGGLLLIVACGGGSPSSPSDGGTSPPPISGLDARPSNASCVAPQAAVGTYALQVVFTGLPITNNLVGLYQVPNDAQWFYAVHKSGHVYRFLNEPNVAQKDLFLDLSNRVNNSGESGLLGMAFHPDYAQNRYVFVYYTGGNPLTSYVERYTALGDFTRVDITSRVVILTVPQPYSNHNGGQLSFDKDRYLYLGLGDGGSGGDPHNHGQNTDTLLGSL